MFKNFSKSYSNFELAYYNDHEKHILLQDENNFKTLTEVEAKLDQYNLLEMSKNSKKN